MKTRWIAAPLLLALLIGSQASAELRVFELQHADAGSLLPVVEPLLAQDESVSAYNHSLVVNADRQVVERIASLLAELDRPPGNLRVSVRRAGSAVERQAGGGYDDRVSVSSGKRVATRGASGESSVRTLEGRPVLLSRGALVPLAADGGWGPGVDYEDLSQGFVVRARVAGDRAVIDIDASDNRAGAGAIHTGRLQGSVSGALGEWILLNDPDSAGRESGAEYGSRYRTRSSVDDRLEIRVERID